MTADGITMAAMTGMPIGKGRRPIRRGGGRHKAPAATPKTPTSAHAHLAQAQTHLAAGNHAAAKTSALNLVKALHAMSAGQPIGKPGNVTGPKTKPGALGLASGGQMPDDSRFLGDV